MPNYDPVINDEEDGVELRTESLSDAIRVPVADTTPEADTPIRLEEWQPIIFWSCIYPLSLWYIGVGLFSFKNCKDIPSSSDFAIAFGATVLIISLCLWRGHGVDPIQMRRALPLVTLFALCLSVWAATISFPEIIRVGPNAECAPLLYHSVFPLALAMGGLGLSSLIVIVVAFLAYLLNLRLDLMLGLLIHIIFLTIFSVGVLGWNECPQMIGLTRFMVPVGFTGPLMFWVSYCDCTPTRGETYLGFPDEQWKAPLGFVMKGFLPVSFCLVFIAINFHESETACQSCVYLMGAAIEFFVLSCLFTPFVIAFIAVGSLVPFAVFVAIRSLTSKVSYSQDLLLLCCREEAW